MENNFFDLKLVIDCKLINIISQIKEFDGLQAGIEKIMTFKTNHLF